MRNGFDSLRSVVLRRVATSLLVIFIAGFITDAHAVYAQQIHALDSELVDSARADIYGTDRTSKDGPLSRVGFDLALLYREYEAYEASGAAEPFQSEALPNASFEGARVTIDATARRGATEALAAALREAGALHVSRFQNVVSARIPIEQIPAVAALSELNAARRAVAATPQPPPSQNSLVPREGLQVGATDSQGDAAMNTDAVRSSFGIDGSGRTIGVLSDSYDTSSSAITDAADDISTGDLPPSDRINVLDDSIPGSDEGRAMMQLIFDVAPGSDLAFHTAFGGQADFANGIIELRDAGSDVIVDDVFYYTEPFFQDGIIAQAVDEVTGVNTGDPDDGVPYFSSAGNNADQSYESETPNFVSPGETVAYDFDPSAATDTLQQITVPNGASFRLSLQWDDPYVSVTGDPGIAADTDLDIFVVDQSGSVVAFSASNNVGGDPIEFLEFTNNGSFDDNGNGTFDLYIQNFDGPNPGRIKYIHSDDLTVEEYATNSPTSFGHSIAEGGAGVGASAWFESPEFGTSPAVPESFTSLGGNAILFNLDGTRKTTPEVRDQPRITGPDGGNTTFFGQSLNDGDSFPNFFGTSASAPHVAGLAALQLQADASLSPTDIYAAQANGASDMEAAGFDFLTGAGFVNAENTITSVNPAITVAPTAVDLGTLFFDTSSGTVFNVPTIDIQVENIGSAPLDITDVTLTGTSFAFTGSGIPTGSLPIGDAVTATIEFAPSSPGAYSESLIITSNDPDTPTVTVSLEADAVLPPVIDVPAASLSEAVETGQTATQSLTITNSGDTALDYDIFAEATGLGSFTPNEVAATASTAPTAGASSNLFEAGLASAPSTSSDGGFDPSEFIYTLDDGSSENNIGLNSDADLLWLNAFETQDGAATITAIASAFGTLATGSPVEFLLYDDPNNDGDPADATLLTSVTTQSEVSDDDQFQVEPIAPTTVSDVFFVAVLAPSAPSSTLPAPIDEDTDVGASWLGFTASGSFDTTDLSGLSPIADAGFPGNWLLRAQGSFVAFDPVSGTIAPESNETVDITFDGTTLPVDIYDGNVAIHSNDPVNGQLSLPFDFFVADAVGEVANVNADGSYAFGNTGLTTNLTGVTGSGTVTAVRFDTPPSNTNGIDTSFDVSSYRWIVVQDNNLQFDAASVLRFERSAIPAPGFDEANGPNVTVYRRGTPDTGTFGALTTTYDDGGTTGDLSDDVLDATGATGFSEFVLASYAAPLPVELTTFDAALNANRVVLSWRTVSETNNVGFEVQRMATSGVDEANAAWRTLAMLNGAGTTDEPQQYRFEDTDLPFAADSLSYRLRQVDSDGTEHITDPISVERSVNQVELLPAYPNPAQDRATLRYAAPPQQRVRIALYDMLGRRVQTLVDGMSSGRTEVQMDLSRLSSGTYFLQLQSNGTVKTQRVTVVR